MSGPEQPFDIRAAIRGLSKPQLEGYITNAKAYLAQPDQPAAPASPAVVSPRLPEHPVPRGGFIEAIDDSLSKAGEPTGKVSVIPRTLAEYLQQLRPQDASLQNIKIDITGEINQALGDILSTLQKQLDEEIADKTWHATGFFISPDHKELVINFANGRMEKARKDLAEIGVGSLKRWIKDFNLKRPKLADLARPALQKPEKPEPSQEELDSFAPKWVNWLADQIVQGRVPPGSSDVEELFALIDGADAAAIKDKVKEKLSAADNPWASAWRSYLETPPAPTGQSPVDFGGERKRVEQDARENLDMAISIFHDAKQQLEKPNLALEEYATLYLYADSAEDVERELAHLKLSPKVMAENILIGKVLPNEQSYLRVKEELTNEADKQALRNELAARVKELAGRKEFPSPQEQAWREAWEKELQGREKPFPDWEELGPPDLME